MEGVNNVEEGHDEPDSTHVVLTIDSAGQEFCDASEASIHSCIHMATQVSPDDLSTTWAECMKKAIVKRITIVAAGLLVVVAIILLERLIGVDIIDEKKLIQDIGAELIPQLRGAYTTTAPPAPPQ
jgi:hypothetical protein